MKVGRWSTTPGSNNATPPDGAPEGQAPSTLNDCMREMMAQIRTVFNDSQYFDQDMTPTFINATSFSVPGNQTSAVHAGRRLKLYDGNTLYGTVSTASFTTVTTIHVDVDTAASLTSSLSSFGIGIVSVTNNGLPRNLALTVSALTVLGTLSASIIAATTLLTANALSVSGGIVVTGTLNVGGTASFTSVTNFGAGVSISATAVVGTLQARAGSLTCVAAGGFICTGDITAFSDARLKSDWRNLPEDFLERLAGLQSGIYTRIDSGYKQVGVNAQELQAFLPEAVHGTPPNYLSVAYGNAAMVACVALARRVLELERFLKERS